MSNHQHTYVVQGMTCEHCAASVTEEIEEIAGVTGVQVDLSSGNVVVTSTAELDAQTVSDAISEAGYEVVS